MNYCEVSNGIITNIITCDDPLFAASMKWKEYYEGAEIGGYYENMSSTEKKLSAQLKAVSDRQEFLEDCIAEMATQVYS